MRAIGIIMPSGKTNMPVISENIAMTTANVIRKSGVVYYILRNKFDVQLLSSKLGDFISAKGKPTKKYCQMM